LGQGPTYIYCITYALYANFYDGGDGVCVYDGGGDASLHDVRDVHGVYVDEYVHFEHALKMTLSKKTPL
jgi:hypothetical protein